MLTTTALALLVAGSTPLTPVAPWQQGAQGHHRAGCDEAGCLISWILTDGGINRAWAAGLSPALPGQVPVSVTMNDVSHGGNVEGHGVGAGLRLHLLDTQGANGDYTIYLAPMGQQSGAIDERGSVAFAPRSGVGSPSKGTCGFSQGVFLCVVESGLDYNDLFFRRVGVDGGFLDSSLTELLTGQGHVFGPTVAPMGDRFAAAWSETATESIRAAIVGVDGVVRAQQVAIDTSPGAKDDAASSTFDGGALLAWTRQTAAGPEVRFATLSPAGGVARPLNPIAAASWPALSWHDTRLLVAYRQAFDGGTHVVAELIDWGQQPTGAGAFVSPGDDDGQPVLARADDSRALLAYRSRSGGGPARVVFTFVGTRRAGEICDSDSACWEGPCVASRCALVTMDGGVLSDEGPRWRPVGCSCASTPDSWVLALTLSWWMVRRRQGSKAPMLGVAGTGLPSKS